MASNPTILQIPGGFTPASAYSRFLAALSDQGFPTVVYDLPSTSRRPPEEPATLSDDVAFFASKISELVEAGADVIVIGHSYGGIVTTAAVSAAKGMTRQERERNGLQGGVVRLILVAGLVGVVGESPGDSMKGHEINTMKTVDEDPRFLVEIPELTAPLMFSDMPLEPALRQVELMPYQSVLAFSEPIAHPIPTDVDICYVSTTADAMLSQDFQKARIELLEEQSGRKVDVRTLDSGHCPNFSNPEGLAEVVRGVLG